VVEGSAAGGACEIKLARTTASTRARRSIEHSLTYTRHATCGAGAKAFPSTDTHGVARHSSCACKSSLISCVMSAQESFQAVLSKPFCCLDGHVDEGICAAAVAGTLYCLLQIHIIPEAYEQLEGTAGSLPLGGFMVIAGLLAMLVLEYVCTWVSVNTAAKRSKHLLPTTTSEPAAPASPVHAHDPTEGCNKLCKIREATGGAAAAATSTPSNGLAMKGDGGREAGHVHDAHMLEVVPSLAHGHGCRQQPACHSEAVKQQVVCITMELGCVFHSVVLGLALGVMTDSPQLVLTLLVVLAVHQAVEGLAIGSVLAATQRLSQRYGLAVIYALTLPVGIAAGMLAANSYNSSSPAAKLVQGVANGLSGGMLLYVSLFSLLAAELAQHDLLHRPFLAAGLLLAVLFGAVVMCVLGMWA